MQDSKQYARQNFTFSNSQHFGKGAMDVHRELYHAYIEQANLVRAASAQGTMLAVINPAIRAREALSRRLAFELNGVLLHEWFFQQLDGAPQTNAPAASSAASLAMEQNFGDFSAWLGDIKSLSQTRGSGWVVSLWDDEHGVLSNVWVDLHQLAVPVGQRVMFVVDLWEHAYWSDFGPKGRAKYFDSVIQDTDWSVIERRFALTLK